MEHIFTAKIKEILKNNFKKHSDDIFERSQLLQYLNEKTRSAGKGSKARSSFANLYALYVIIEDYIANKFHKKGDYSKYEGAEFSQLFRRQRELPFGSKLQNHALNNRMNAEFQKYFPQSKFIPVLRNLDTNKYWINENLLNITIGKKKFNIAESTLEIIVEYVKTKQDAFLRFIKTCEELQKIESSSHTEIKTFIDSLLAPNADARLFEIVSYSILKFFYNDQVIIWGYDMDSLLKENLKLYKTGRTNANDGGIDFVMKPLGRFFQVTETLDFRKYFLDIDKIQKYPITFVIKSEKLIQDLRNEIKENAEESYSVKSIVEKYLNCVEEIVNLPLLTEVTQNKKMLRLGTKN